MAKKNIKVDEQMVENITKQNDEIAAELIALISRDGLRWCKEWRDAPVGISGSSGKAYQGRNAFITVYAENMMGSSDPRWYTERSLLKNGYVIDDDAEPVYIEKWRSVRSGRKVEVTDEDGNVTEEWRTFHYMKLVGGWVVYNAEDVYGLEPYDGPDYNVSIDDAGQLADEFITTSRCRVYECSDNDGAYYSPTDDYIHMPDRKLFTSNDAFLRTLLHEMTHSTKAVLHRKQSTSWGDDDYAFEELVAELGSAFTAAATGYEIGDEFIAKQGTEYAEQHAAYLKSWSKRFNDAPAEIFKAAALANTACLYLLGRLYGWDEQEQAA